MAQHGEKWNRELFENKLMGYSMRTDRYRFVAWKDRTNPDVEPVDVELYDHQTDPSETKNIADKYPELVAKLTAQLLTGWKGNMAK